MNVASITVTVTDKTQPGRTVLDLLQNGSGNGYTVVGTLQGNVGWNKVGYRSIQYVSGGSIYIGAGDVANDGTCQGITLSASGLTVWDRDDYGSPIPLEIIVRVSANSTVFNIHVEGE